MTRRAIFQTLAGGFAALRGGAEVFRGRVGGVAHAKPDGMTQWYVSAVDHERFVATILPLEEKYQKPLQHRSFRTNGKTQMISDYFEAMDKVNANRSQTPVRTARMS